MSYPIACIACIPNAQSTQHCMLCVTVTVSLKHIFHLVPMQIEFIAYTFSYYWMAVMCFPHVNAVKWYDSCSFANLSIHITTTGKEYSLPMWWPTCLNLIFCNVWADPNWMVGILQKNTFQMLNSSNFSMLNFGGKSKWPLSSCEAHAISMAVFCWCCMSSAFLIYDSRNIDTGFIQLCGQTYLALCMKLIFNTHLWLLQHQIVFLDDLFA